MDCMVMGSQRVRHDGATFTFTFLSFTSPKSFSFFPHAFIPNTLYALTHLIFTTSFEIVAIIFPKRKMREKRHHMS